MAIVFLARDRRHERDVAVKVLRPELAAGMEHWVPNLRGTHLIADCGHWTQQEKPDEVSRALIGFLKTL